MIKNLAIVFVGGLISWAYLSIVTNKEAIAGLEAVDERRTKGEQKLLI